MKTQLRTLGLCLMLINVCEAQEIELRVMTFNIWYGGEQVAFEQTAEAIRIAQPDLVAIQEPDGNLRKLAASSGLSYVDEKRNILSRYPLFDPDLDDRRYPYTRVLVRPGKIVAIANTHLTSSPFGPDLLREGETPGEVLENEKQVRVRELTPFLAPLRQLAESGVPVFFAGDFNSPSHEDWLQRPEGPRIEWPVTKMLADNGFRDAYRTVHADASKKPGLTWTPGYPHPYIKDSEIKERIDMIWYAGPVQAVESKIIGEKGNPSVDIFVDPYPSDHRSVLSTFRVKAIAAPAMIVVDTPSFEQGNDFVVRFQTPNQGDWSVSIVPRAGEANRDAVLSAKGPTVLSTRPTMRFSSSGLSAGSYDAVLLNTAFQEIARTNFTVLPLHAVAELRIDPSVEPEPDLIQVSWRNSPGMKHDWIGLYRAEDPDVFGYLAFLYTGAKVEGSLRIDGSVLREPLPAGDYELRLFREDSYAMLARVRFTIR